MMILAFSYLLYCAPEKAMYPQFLLIFFKKSVTINFYICAKYLSLVTKTTSHGDSYWHYIALIQSSDALVKVLDCA